MKKNYALFLTGIVALGLIFSLGFTGCENAVGETGPAGEDYFNKLEIFRSNGSGGDVVVARGSSADFEVTFNRSEIVEPDPASVTWKVYGAGQVLGQPPVTASGTYIDYGTGYYGVNRNKVKLYVAGNESCETLFIEASYKGFTRTLPVVVGLPKQKVTLQPGATTNIGSSHITQYGWVGRDDPEATTYLVYETGNEAVGDLRNGATVPATVIGTYHLNDDIPVTAGNWVTFYEVSANNTASIISYGSDLAYIYARTSTGKLNDVGSGTDGVTIYSNIRLPTTEDLPTLTGAFTTGGAHTTYANSIDTTNYIGSSPPAAGVTQVYVKIAANGTKIKDKHTGALVYEGDIFKEFNPNLVIPGIGTGGYDLSTAPNGHAIDVNATTATTPNPFVPDLKTGWHRYVVKHESGAWNFTDSNGETPCFPSRPTISIKGIYVNQNKVTVRDVVVTGNAPPAAANLLKVTPVGKFKANVDPAKFNSGTGFLTWFADADGYAEDPASITTPRDSVTLVRNAWATNLLAGDGLVVDASAFDYGIAPLAETGVTGFTAQWIRREYAVITATRVDATNTPGVTFTWPSPFGDPNAGGSGIHGVEFTVQAPGYGPPLPGPTGSDSKDYVTLNWYYVDGSLWDPISPYYYGTNKPTAWTGPTAFPVYPTGAGDVYGPVFDGSTHYSGVTYKSAFQPRPETTSPGGPHIGSYGRTIGLWINQANDNVRFVSNDTLGKKIGSQIIVGEVH